MAVIYSWPKALARCRTGVREPTGELEEILTSPSFFDDPYPVYRRLRDAQPVYWSDTFKSWLVTRHADSIACLRDPRLSGRRTSSFLDAQLPREWQDVVEPLRTQLTTFIGFSDPPDHTRLRRLVNKAFTAGVVERMRPRIQSIADELVDALEATAGPDLVRDFAFPLPAIVIAETLGVPPSDRHRFKLWADEFVGFITAGQLTLDIVTTAQHGLAQLREYVLSILDTRREHPADDLMSRLLSAETEGNRLTTEELLSMCITMLIGGHETTTNLIANGTLALLRQPSQRAILLNDPDLIPGAVEELLRFDAPLQRTFRVATEDMRIGNTPIQKGRIVSVMLGAANRDPTAFSNPDALDILRPADHHAGFGHGIHYCVGAPLARLEVAIALSTLLRRLPRMSLATEQLEYQHTLGLRALKSLPLSLN